ncbi:MAG TPA: OsmC family protein, partial [Acidimicrobiia bacterium]|nr:OsmC family protein [Acidimicrobiia bacterium]
MTAAPSPPSIRDAVDAARQKVGDDPTRAVVRLRTEARMEEGTRVDIRAGTFEFAADEPVSVGGTGTAANPVQMALAALGSCQAITYRYWAEELGLRLDGVTV